MAPPDTYLPRNAASLLALVEPQLLQRAQVVRAVQPKAGVALLQPAQLGRGGLAVVVGQLGVDSLGHGRRVVGGGVDVVGVLLWGGRHDTVC